MNSKLAEMTDEEAESHVLSVLTEHGKMTTRELESEVQKTGKRCPDSAVRFLMRLKTANKIRGEVSVEKGGWLWWVEEKG
jgi:repressor of nif and glnA expression